MQPPPQPGLDLGADPILRPIQPDLFSARFARHVGHDSGDGVAQRRLRIRVEVPATWTFTGR
nr:hypothetical protein Ade03nite_31900 [Actinoplanes derwentensis]